MIYFTSDTHFNHKRVIEICDRPFADIDEMNQSLIDSWNARVTDEDIVYHLGDFAMGKRTLIPEVLRQLRGTIVLVAGNHDYKRDDKYYTHVARPATMLQHGETLIELVHDPREVTGSGDIAFCGHVHGRWADLVRGHKSPAMTYGRKHVPAWQAPTHIYNVGVDVRGFRPVTFEEIVSP